MDGLIDSLLEEQWQEVSTGERGDGFHDYFINRNPKQVDENTLHIMVSDDDGNGTNVLLNGARPKKNPLGGIGRCELKIDAEKNLVGIDLDGDCVVRRR